MRVLMVHNEYARPSGEEHAVRSIAALLGERGHDVRWLLRSSAGLAGSAAAQARAFFSGIYSFAARREMAHRLDAEAADRPPVGIDLVQVQNLFPLLSPSVLAPCRERGVPVVMRCPNYRLSCPTGLHLSRGAPCERCLSAGREAWCVLRNCAGSLPRSIGYAARHFAARLTASIRRNVDVFVVLSEFQRGRFVAAGIEPERIEVLPNIVPVPRADPPAPWEPGETVSFAGRLSPEKGFEHFLAAARALPEVPFAVAGDASQATELVRAAPPNVAFRGFLSGGDLEVFFRRTRVLVFSSICYEGFPVVVAKAMGAGKPVVCSRLGGLPEIVDEGITGLLFEPGDERQLAEQLRFLYERPGLCRTMGEAGRRKALSAWSPDRCYARLMAIYEKAHALAGRRAPRRAAIPLPAKRPLPSTQAQEVHP